MNLFSNLFSTPHMPRLPLAKPEPNQPDDQDKIDQDEIDLNKKTSSEMTEKNQQQPFVIDDELIEDLDDIDRASLKISQAMEDFFMDRYKTIVADVISDRSFRQNDHKVDFAAILTQSIKEFFLLDHASALSTRVQALQNAWKILGKMSIEANDIQSSEFAVACQTQEKIAADQMQRAEDQEKKRYEEEVSAFDLKKQKQKRNQSDYDSFYDAHVEIIKRESQLLQNSGNLSQILSNYKENRRLLVSNDEVILGLKNLTHHWLVIAAKQLKALGYDNQPIDHFIQIKAPPRPEHKSDTSPDHVIITHDPIDQSKIAQSEPEPSPAADRYKSKMRF